LHILGVKTNSKPFHSKVDAIQSIHHNVDSVIIIIRRVRGAELTTGALLLLSTALPCVDAGRASCRGPQDNVNPGECHLHRLGRKTRPRHCNPQLAGKGSLHVESWEERRELQVQVVKDESVALQSNPKRRILPCRADKALQVVGQKTLNYARSDSVCECRRGAW